MRLIIGYGNTLRSDDGLGQYLAELLGQGSTVITGIQLTPELAEPVSCAEGVVFLDARYGVVPGQVACQPVAPLPAAPALMHNVTPESLLASARELYGAAPDAVLITVTGASFDLGGTFSPEICAQLPQIAKTAAEMIASFFESCRTVHVGARRALPLQTPIL